MTITGETAAEFAVLVRSRLKGHGIGWLLMKRIIEFAKRKGLKAMHGQVLCENTTMLAMCGELGFRISGDPADLGVKIATLSLSGEQTAGSLGATNDDRIANRIAQKTVLNKK